MKDKDIHFRIDRQLFARFESALRFEGLNKTEFITHAIVNFCSKVERKQHTNLLRQYAMSESLLVRIHTHSTYEERRIDMDGACLEALGLIGTESILDVGCGPGDLLIRLSKNRHMGRMVGLDLSPGMINEAKASSTDTIEWIVGDANKMPFDDGAFERIAAKHMLYHVSNPEDTLIEVKRVLSLNGIAAFTTNSARSTPRIFDIFNRMLLEFGFPEVEPAVSTFSMENAIAQLSRIFSDVKEIRFPNALIFHEAAPIVSYIFSMFSFFDLPDDQETLAEMRGWLNAEIKRKLSDLNRVWRDPKEAGLYICRCAN